MFVVIKIIVYKKIIFIYPLKCVIFCNECDKIRYVTPHIIVKSIYLIEFLPHPKKHDNKLHDLVEISVLSNYNEIPICNMHLYG